jgi:hypothetical protein
MDFPSREGIRPPGFLRRAAAGNAFFGAAVE